MNNDSLSLMNKIYKSIKVETPSLLTARHDSGPHFLQQRHVLCILLHNRINELTLEFT